VVSSDLLNTFDCTTGLRSDLLDESIADTFVLVASLPLLLQPGNRPGALKCDIDRAKPGVRFRQRKLAKAFC